MPLRAAHVVPAIGHEASGPSYTVPRLCRALVDAGVEIHLHVLARGSAAVAAGLDVRQHAEWPGPFRRLCVSPDMHRALIDEAGRADVIHNHSLWTLPNVYPGLAVRGTSCRLVTSPRGVLDGWARRRARWRKRAMWWLGQRRTLERTACFHATSEAEYVSVREAGLRAPVAIVPNGIDLPAAVARRAEGARPRRLLFLGRVHPKKGVDTLLDAWARVARRFPDWELSVVGPGEGTYGDEMRRRAELLGSPRVRFHEGAYGDDKWRTMAEAQLFVLPTRAENFGIAVAEALASSLPAIVTKGAPWGGLAAERCGWWIEQGVDALAAALEYALALPAEELLAMGERGRAWMSRDFSWRAIGETMARTYEWTVRGGPAPAWVRVD
jgi:glycosyltransferase involved in cell wall biosynthesis